MKLVFKYIYFFWVLILVENSYCQTNTNFYRFNFKIGDELVTDPYFAKPTSGNTYSKSNFFLSSNYRVIYNFDIGVYGGKGSIFYLESIHGTTMRTSKTSKFWYYGMEINYHILPLFTKTDKFRFDLYAHAKLGLAKNNSPLTETFNNKNYVESRIGVGCVFYLWHYAGVFTEYSYGKIIFNNSRCRFGLTIRI